MALNVVGERVQDGLIVDRNGYSRFKTGPVRAVRVWLLPTKLGHHQCFLVIEEAFADGEHGQSQVVRYRFHLRVLD